MALSPDDLMAADAIVAGLAPLSDAARDQLALLLRPAVLAVRRARAQERATKSRRASGGGEATT